MAVVSGHSMSVSGQQGVHAVPAPRSGHSSRPVHRPARLSAPAHARDLRITTSMSSPDAAVLHVKGEVVGANAGRLKELMLQRVRSGVATLIVDLTEVSFLDVSGLRVLATMKQCATLNHTQLVLVSGSNPAVVRPLRAAAVAGARLLAA